MVNNNTQVKALVPLLLLSPVTWSAPPLKMHIFEQEEQKEPAKQVSNLPLLEMHVFEQQQKQVPINQKTQAPLLKLHVFDRSPEMKNNAVVAKRYTNKNTQEKDELALSYVKSESYLKVGYRQDNLQWSIAGPEGTPNILSELTWTDIKIATVSTGTTFLFESNWLIDLNLLFGSIYSGENQDSDYLGDDRTIEFSRSNNSGDEGSVLDISAATGYNWALAFSQKSPYPSIELRPQIGLSYYSQNLKITDGNQTLNSDLIEVPLGPFPGANTTYDATWFGPWLGLKSKFNFTDSFSLILNLEYHYVKYSSTADWNLRTAFAHPESFTHKADGYGLVGNIEGVFKLDKQLALNLSLSYLNWQAHNDGIDKKYLADDTILTTKFNGIDWKSVGANIGLVYSF
jgi:hypothetical protein